MQFNILFVLIILFKILFDLNWPYILINIVRFLKYIILEIKIIILMNFIVNLEFLFFLIILVFIKKHFITNLIKFINLKIINLFLYF